LLKTRRAESTSMQCYANHSLIRYQSPLGPMHLTASERGLSGVWFESQKHGPDQARLSAWQAPQRESFQAQTLQRCSDQLGVYFAGVQADFLFDLPLDLSVGTAFQQAVWAQLRTISTGQSLSYGAIAQALGKPKAARAVGAAVGRNPVSIIVPCHRVLGVRGALTGYAGGLSRKQSLLSLEQKAPSLMQKSQSI
jgi:methylated-DNA-[protein]-cysteine S-methyltransferase